MSSTRLHQRLALSFLVVCASGYLLPTPGATESAGALRDLVGTVVAIEEVTLDEGTTPWLEVVVQTPDEERLRARVAPAAVLEESGFELKPGQRVRIRVFVEETPPGTSRVRNMDSGQMLRLRCLHGEPLWTYHGLGAGARSPQQQRGMENRGRR
jgi:hypothetical protein